MVLYTLCLSCYYFYIVLSLYLYCCYVVYIVISTYYLLVITGNSSVFFYFFYLSLSVWFGQWYISLCQAWALSRASSVLFGTPRPPSPTIHYTLPRFILKDPGLQPLRNPQKQGAIRDVMTNPKTTLGLTRGGKSLHKP